MRRTLLLLTAAVPLAAAGPAPPGGATPAPATGNAAGSAALALAAIVGGYSPLVPGQQKALLARLLNGTIPPNAAHRPPINVKSSKIVCSAGNVDITAHTCSLSFEAHTVTIRGRPAHELYATLIEAGIPSNGAAGTIYESLTALACTVTPAEVAQKAGGGAECSFTPGP